VRPKTHPRFPFTKSVPVILAAVAAVALAACASSGSSGTPSASTGPHHGGSLTVLEGSSFAGAWPGLDPATDTDGAANQSYMNSIFGELFALGSGGKLIPDLATGYAFSNGGKTIDVTLRQGVTFSDGTAFNAAAVVWNWKRDLAGTCTCKPVFLAQPKIAPTGPYSVSLTLPYVDAPFINGIQDNIFNWIASPTAVSKMGEKAFALKPVGAGPFTVVSDTPSSQLVLKRNPHYWETGKPYLDTLIFKPVAADEPAYEAMLAGSGQAYEGMSTPQLVNTFKSHFTLTAEPSTSPYDIQLNTRVAPFNNIKARQAIYYATNAAQIDAKLFNNTYPVTQSFTAAARAVLRAGGARLHRLRPGEGQGTGQAAWRPEHHPLHHHQPGRRVFGRGAADAVAGGRDEGDPENLRPDRADRRLPVTQVAGVPADSRGV
jgi:peptide/nickel transport system substrate-binding protein